MKVDAIDWSNPYAARFRDAMNDDFDTPIAFSVLHELRGEVNRTRSPELAGLLKALGGTIGLLQQDAETFLQGRHPPRRAGAHRRAQRREEGEELRARRRDPQAARGGGHRLEDKPGGVTEWRKK